MDSGKSLTSETRVVECTLPGKSSTVIIPWLSVEAVGGPENLVLEVDYEPGHEDLIIGAPGRPWTDPHGHMGVAVSWRSEAPPRTVTRVGLAADEVGHGQCGRGSCLTACFRPPSPCSVLTSRPFPSAPTSGRPSRPGSATRPAYRRPRSGPHGLHPGPAVSRSSLDR